MTTSPDDDLEEADAIEAMVELAVIAGFTSLEILVKDAEDVADDEGLDPERARRLVGERWAAALEEQKSWPDVTDSDRLDEAFAELEVEGIVARSDFTCCQSCGHSEIAGVVPEGRQVDGYVFFHHQDTESLPFGTLYLAWGAFGEFADPRAYEEAALAVGVRVAAALRRHGLQVEWDGSNTQRIQLVNLAWRRRLPQPTS